MMALFETVGWNTLVALGLAVSVMLVGRVWKRPELIHVLWLVVLVKLVTPGIVRIDAIPTFAEPVAAVATPAPAKEMFVATPVAATVASASIDWTQVVFVVWVVGTLLFLGVAIVRVRAFLRSLRVSVPADPELIESIDHLAWLIDVHPRPRVRVVDAAVSPMVWGGLGGATLILPLRLMRELDVSERDALLAHELAHLKRGDCWVRWIELAVTAALWWNPVVWWVRRNLRRAEEQACDRWVLELLPRARRAYADGIVKTVEFLAGHGPTPALATGATGTRHIQERLTMILDPSRPGRLRRPLVPALLIALLALPVIPGFADRDDSRDDEAKAELYELEREALELERRLHQIQRQREEVERRLEVGRFKRDSVEMTRQVNELRSRGMLEAAVELEADLERSQRRLSEEVEWDRERLSEEEAMQEAKLQWREALIQREYAEQGEDAEAARAYEKALQQFELEMHDRQMAMREAEIAYEKAREIEITREIKAKLEALARESDQLADTGDRLAAEEIREQMRRMETELSETSGRQQRETARLIKLRAEVMQQLEMVGVEMGRAKGDRRRQLETDLEDLSRRLEDLETELSRIGTAR